MAVAPLQGQDVTYRVHPQLGDLESFFFGQCRSAALRASVVEHLIGGCGLCHQHASLLLADSAARRCLGGASASVDQRSEVLYGRAFDSALQSALRASAQLGSEAGEVAGLAERLMKQPPRRQLLLIRNSYRYQSRALCEALLDASWGARFDDPKRCSDLARAALAVAGRLRAEAVGGEGALRTLQARCWAELANALKIQSDYRAAAEAFDRAETLLRGGESLDEVARFHFLKSAYWVARRRYDEAEAAATRSMALYREVGDLHSLGMAIIQKAVVAGYLEDPDREIALLRFGVDLASIELEPRVVLIGWHNLIWALHSSGRNREALALLSRARPAYLEVADRLALVRFQWLEGIIARSLDRREQAEGCLAEAREGFVQLGVPHEAALVSLELAALLADQGRNLEVCRLASEMITIFESRECRQETLAALILLRQAAERGRVTEKLVQRLVSSVQKAGA